MADLLPNPRICEGCGVAGCELKCACKLVYYCGQDCQKKDFRTHKKQCLAVLDKKLKEARRKHGKDDMKVGEASEKVGKSFARHGRYAEAERYFLETRRILVKIFGKGHENWRVGQVCDDLATIHIQMGKLDKAMHMYNEALSIRRLHYGERSAMAGKCLRNIGDVIFDQGKYQEALEKYEEALDMYKEIFGPDKSPDGALIHVLTSKGSCYLRMGRLEEARAALEEALQMTRRACGSESGQYGTVLLNLGTVYLMQELNVEARANFEEAIGIFRRVHGERHPDVATCFNNIGGILLRQKQYDEALKMSSKALKIQRRVLGEVHEQVAGTLLTLGTICGHQGKNDEALKWYEESLDIFQRVLGVESRFCADAQSGLALTQCSLGENGGGAVFFVRGLESARAAVRIYQKHDISDGKLECAQEILRYAEGKVCRGEDRGDSGGRSTQRNSDEERQRE